ncbi:hypothetical protein D3C73_1393130 [compost metagenome]
MAFRHTGIKLLQDTEENGVRFLKVADLGKHACQVAVVDGIVRLVLHGAAEVF